MPDESSQPPRRDAAAAVPHVAVVARQQKLLKTILGDLVAAGSRVALLDFPNHNNVGDNAIWLGEKACLDAIGARLVYQCDLASFSPRRLLQQLGPEGIILLHGGGNFGTVWPQHQAFREEVVARFTDHRVIQLPQSVHFADGHRVEEARRALGGHPALTVLVRDERSQRFVVECLGLAARLCPDMAVMIGQVPRAGMSLCDVLWISRSDHEARPEDRLAGDLPATGLSVEQVDWLVGEPGRPWSRTAARLTVRVRRTVQRWLGASPRLRDAWGHRIAGSFDHLARRRFERGIRILSRGRVVVTDRLHGHILSLLLGIPHVLLDNHYGKLDAYHRAFTADAAGVVTATDAAEAVRLAKALLDRLPA